jgi:hypothetical protein
MKLFAGLLAGFGFVCGLFAAGQFEQPAQLLILSGLLIIQSFWLRGE